MTDSRTGSVVVEERVIAAFMDKLRSAPPEMTPKMPGADVLWVKARLIRQWEVQRKVRRPIDVMEPVELATGPWLPGCS